jgi:hypothetical protein
VTVVKIQKPLGGVPLWMVCDKLRVRIEYLELNELPKSVVALFDNAPQYSRERAVQYLDGAEWNQDQQTWNLSQVTPVTRRLIW